MVNMKLLMAVPLMMIGVVLAAPIDASEDHILSYDGIFPILSTTMGKHHDDLEIIKFIVNFEDGSLREVPVADVDEVIVSIPSCAHFNVSFNSKMSLANSAYIPPKALKISAIVLLLSAKSIS